MAQVPPPPQADGRKTDWPAKALRRVDPGLISRLLSGSLFISINALYLAATIDFQQNLGLKPKPKRVL